MVSLLSELADSCLKGRIAMNCISVTDKSSVCVEEKENDLFTCPVCGRLISAINVPMKESIIEEKLREEGMTFPNCTMTMHYESYHVLDGDEMVLDDFHPVTFVIDIVYDTAGKCIVFDVVGVHK